MPRRVAERSRGQERRKHGLRGRVEQEAQSPPVREPVVDRVEARCVHAALCENDCGVRDARSREHGAPVVNANERDRRACKGEMDSGSWVCVAGCGSGA
jgi:hypothetical protein